MKLSFLSLLKGPQLYKEINFFHSTSFLVFFVLLAVPFAVFDGFLDPYTTIKWVLTLISINALIFIFILKNKTLALPKFPHAALYLLVLILFLIIFNSYYHNVPLYTYENVRRFLFWGAVTFFCNLFYLENEKKFEKFEYAIFLALVIFIFCSFLQFIVYPELPPYFTFGNINLASEYVLFSLSFLLGILNRLWEKASKTGFLNILAALCIAHIYLTSSRSAYIAVLIIFTLFTLLNIKHIKKIIKIIFMSAILILMIVLIKYLYPGPPPDLFLLKDFSARWLLYTNTLKMVSDMPLGVGVGQYEFASLPYLGEIFPRFNETKIFLSPHDEFLHYLSEDGVIFSLLLFLLGCSLIYGFWKEIKAVFLKYTEFLYFSIAFFLQALFQFPLLGPYPYFLTALLVGYFFSVIKVDHKVYMLNRLSKTILCLLNLVATFVLIFHFSSQYIAFHYPENEKMNKFACSAGRNWFACLNVSSCYLHQGNLDQAEIYARKTLEWQPLNFQGMKMLGFIHLYQGERRKACNLFKKFNSFFQNQSSLRDVILHECSSLPQEHESKQP